MRVPVVLVVVAACGYPPLADVPDAMVDARTCFGSLVPICFARLPTRSVEIAAQSIDTDTSSLCDDDHDQAERFCVIAGTTVTLARGDVIGVQGSKPLVLFATSRVEIAGVVDAVSYHYGSARRAAGANPAGLCSGGTPASGFSGGAGGSLAGVGGSGFAVGGIAGGPGPRGAVEHGLRGGCPGGDGGAGGGRGGSGGGAIAIIAAEAHVAGTINASGAGGNGGSATQSGGGGGGAGGMIVLDADSITISGAASLVVNGGGGGQGGSIAAAGADGGESPAASVPGSPGSTAANAGGPGGRGAFDGMLDGAHAGTATGSGAGGGGGGGGAGFIRMIGRIAMQHGVPE